MSDEELLSGVTAVVTGASRGAGKGIACALGSAGAVVYVTGRSEVEGSAPLPGTVYATAKAVDVAGGTGVPVVCDHGDDDQVTKLFERVKAERGSLDILVNNATELHDQLIVSGPFWKKSADMANILDVGLRSSYIATWHAAPLMVGHDDSSLVVFTSTYGANCYAHGPAYGAQKAGTDKLAHDMAIDFREDNVSTVSIWMGLLKTERTMAALASEPGKFKFLTQVGTETPEFTGHLITALYADPKIMDRSGQVFIGAELAHEYNISDKDGRSPPSHRESLGGPARVNPAITG